MILVFLWLSSAAFVVVVSSAHAGVQAVGLARRATSPALRWAVIAAIAALTVAVEGIEGPNDGQHPIALVPRFVKWAWWSGVLAALHHPVRYLSLPLLLVGQAASVGFILGPTEALAFGDPEVRLAWTLDKATLLEAVVRETFTAVWGTALEFPADAVFGYLGALAPWLFPLAAALFVAVTHGLLRGVTRGELAPLPVGPLGLAAVGLLPLAWVSALLGPAGLWVEDAARVAWLLHCWGTLRVLWHEGSSTDEAPVGARWTRLLGRRGAVVLGLALCVLPDVAGPLLGVLGVAWRVLPAPGGIRVSAAANAAVRLTGWPALLSAGLLYAVLRSIELQPSNPQAAGETRPTGSWPAGQASDPATALSRCATRGGRLVSLASWRAAANRTGWSWVEVPSAAGRVTGLARDFSRDPGAPAVLVVAAAYSERLGSPRAATRCSSR